MDWPIGPYGTSMGALLLLTLPTHYLLTRDEKDRRVSLRELPREIREKGYWWHISLYVLMFLYKAAIVNIELGDMSSAKQNLSRIVSDYPESQQFNTAQGLASSIANS